MAKLVLCYIDVNWWIANVWILQSDEVRSERVCLKWGYPVQLNITYSETFGGFYYGSFFMIDFYFVHPLSRTLYILVDEQSAELLSLLSKNM